MSPNKIAQSYNKAIAIAEQQSNCNLNSTKPQQTNHIFLT